MTCVETWMPGSCCDKATMVGWRPRISTLMGTTAWEKSSWLNSSGLMAIVGKGKHFTCVSLQKDECWRYPTDHQKIRERFWHLWLSSDIEWSQNSFENQNSNNQVKMILSIEWMESVIITNQFINCILEITEWQLNYSQQKASTF